MPGSFLKGNTMNIKNKITLSLVVLASFSAQTIFSAEIEVENEHDKAVYVAVYKDVTTLTKKRSAEGNIKSTRKRSVIRYGDVFKLEENDEKKLTIPGIRVPRERESRSAVVESSTVLIASRKESNLMDKFYIITDDTVPFHKKHYEKDTKKYESLTKIEVFDDEKYKIRKKGNKLKIVERRVERRPRISGTSRHP